jgi:hypothetical protein
MIQLVYAYLGRGTSLSTEYLNSRIIGGKQSFHQNAHELYRLRTFPVSDNKDKFVITS